MFVDGKFSIAIFDNGNATKMYKVPHDINMVE